jgi:hypothetical protein
LKKGGWGGFKREIATAPLRGLGLAEILPCPLLKGGNEEEAALTRPAAVQILRLLVSRKEVPTFGQQAHPLQAEEACQGEGHNALLCPHRSKNSLLVYCVLAVEITVN